MNVLHLSDTTLSGSPYRLSKLYGKYSGHNSRHIVWQRQIYNRVFPCDIVGEETSSEELYELVHKWADVIHYHNRWKRQEIFKHIPLPKGKKEVIQIHSPRDSGDAERGFIEEVRSKIPLAVIAQYHPRQWPELRFIVPNVVDIHDELHKPIVKPFREMPAVAYAPSSAGGTGWDRKSYPVVNRFLRRLNLKQQIIYPRIFGLPLEECLQKKQKCDIGIDEVSTGSYHMSSLEFLSMGIATIAYIDPLTEKVVKDLTGSRKLPWVVATETSFPSVFTGLISSNSFGEIGQKSREWMEKYWNPDVLCSHYTNMYEAL